MMRHLGHSWTKLTERKMLQVRATCPHNAVPVTINMAAIANTYVGNCPSCTRRVAEMDTKAAYTNLTSEYPSE